MNSSYLLHSPAGKQWQIIGTKPHHGLNIPLFSLHSAQSSGIGEFPDLLPMINWCASLGFNVIQLLPLNDTGLDSSPYSALSAFALNPLHLGLTSLPYIDEHSSLLDELRAIPKHLTNLRLNYPVIREYKYRFLKHYYELVREKIIQSIDYHHFVKDSPWLEGYALFKTLKTQHQWASWEQWPKSLQNPTPTLIQKLVALHQQEIEWHSVVQFLCDQQLKAVKKRADEQKVFMMGDIPILTSRDSADVWLHRELYHMEYSAGAPPDQFNADGQNWDFPIYNWKEIAQQGYQWWIERLQVACRYYHIYRIDHIIGFFRIWAIPFGLTGKDGRFIPFDQTFWIDHGQKIMLMMLEHCSMLPIGEDLGIVPSSVRLCLNALGICGTKVIRWERAWDTDSHFIPLDEYLQASMTTVSTHDSVSLPLWWQDYPLEANAYAKFKGWTYNRALSREHLREILWDSHHTNSLFHINLLQEYLSLIPGLCWPHLEDERINIPGVSSPENWSLRFKPSVEEIINNPSLSHLMRELIL